MGYDLSRAALVVVSVLTVLLAASLFPATGHGTYPGTVGDGVAGPSDVDAPAGVEDPAGTVENTDTTTRTTQEPTATETTVGTDSQGRTDTPTTREPTATTEEQDDDPAGASDPELDGGFPLVGFLLQHASASHAPQQSRLRSARTAMPPLQPPQLKTRPLHRLRRQHGLDVDHAP